MVAQPTSSDPRTERPVRPGTNGEGALDLDIVVIAAPDSQVDLLVRELQRHRARVRRIWPLPDKFPGDADVILADYAEGMIDRLPWMPGEARSAVIVLASGERPPGVDRLLDSAPNAILFRPWRPEQVVASVLVAHREFDYAKRLRERIDRLDENLRTIRHVERAKGILMSTRGLSEDDAYRFLRRQAMDRRTTVNAIAAAVIDSYELLG